MYWECAGLDEETLDTGMKARKQSLASVCAVLVRECIMLHHAPSHSCCKHTPPSAPQAAAAAMAAAANAAAAGAGGPGGPRGGGPRNRVPRRYLRMMETSTYSAKTAMAAKTAAGVAVAGGGDGLGSPGASDTPTTAAGDTVRAGGRGSRGGKGEGSTRLRGTVDRDWVGTRKHWLCPARYVLTRAFA